MKYGVALTEEVEFHLAEHLLADAHQEDLCFALWYPSAGHERMSALVHTIIFPLQGERLLHGNASVTPEYFQRALGEAMQAKSGLVFLHSHPVPGWQDMSRDDFNTERAMAAQAKAATGFPLLGMTMGTDKSLSARFWNRIGPSAYAREWCETVRVIGQNGLKVTFADLLLPPPQSREEQKRTVSAWGIKMQQKLARLKIGVVGVGSVGSIVAESLARLGIQDVRLIDFDIVERHNLDRLLHAKKDDYVHKRLKVDVLAKALVESATAENFHIESIPYGVTEDDGFRAALDCDVLFSCVDKPWGRYALNLIAYAHLIPVIDGGIAVVTKKDTTIQGADWQANTVGPTRMCLECLGQYDSAFIDMERRGDLDDPKYINTLEKNHTLRRNENVFPFSAHLASMEVLQMLSLVIAPLGISNVGTQQYHFVTGSMDIERNIGCWGYCIFPSFIARGDSLDFKVTAEHPKAKLIRKETAKRKGIMNLVFELVPVLKRKRR